MDELRALNLGSDYMIYFVTVVMVCAMLYAFNGLVFSEEIHNLSGMLDNMKLTIVLASIVVVVIIGWLVSYTTGFMLSRRSRELGTYLLIGLENRQVARLFFLENLAVGSVALLFGIPLGNLVYQALRAILLTMLSAPYHFHYRFSLKAIGLTFVYFAAIYFFALVRSRKQIHRMKIYDLIYFERQNEEELVKKSKTRKTLFAVSLVFGTAGTFLLMTAGNLLTGVFGAGCIIVFIYGFFTSFSSGIPAYFDRKPKRKYQGQNLMVFRTLAAKLSAMGIVMATVALLFMNDEWDYLYSKAGNLRDTAVWSAISVFPLFYLALTLAMTAATVLTVQQLSEAGRFRRQFELLRKLGMDRQEMRRTLFLQLGIYYLMPVIPPVLIAVPFILDLCDGVEPGTMVGASSPPMILFVSLGLFFLVYLLYMVIACISMKRNVLPEPADMEYTARL